MEAVRNTIMGKFEAWGRPKDSPVRPAFPDWVGVDADNRLVVGGRVNDATGRIDRALTWFKDPDVAQVEMLDFGAVGGTGVGGSYSILTRTTYQKWDQSQLFAESDWRKHVDSYAEVIGGSSAAPPWSEQEGQVRTQVEKLLGARLATLSLNNACNKPTVSITASHGGKSEQDRLQEATVLAAVLVTSSSAQCIQLEYSDAEKVRNIQIVRSSLVEWAKDSADLVDIPHSITVDGQKPDFKGKSNAPMAWVPGDLSVLLELRDRLTALVPKGTRLTLGLLNEDFGHLVVLEATLPDGQPWEQAYATYVDVIDRLFLESHTLDHVQLLLHQGATSELLRFDRNDWAVRHFLMQQRDAAPNSRDLPLIAKLYLRFKNVTQ